MAVFGTDSFLARPRSKMFLVRFAVRVMVMGIFSGSAPFLPFNMLGNYMSSLHLCHLIATSGPGVFFSMGGCLDLVVLVIVTLGLLLLVI